MKKTTTKNKNGWEKKKKGLDKNEIIKENDDNNARKNSNCKMQKQKNSNNNSHSITSFEDTRVEYGKFVRIVIGALRIIVMTLVARY